MSNFTKITLSAIAQIVMLVSLSNVAVASDSSFNSTMKIISSVLSVSEVKALEFGEALIGSNQTIVTQAVNSKAAVFNVTGIANAAVTTSVVQKRIVMTTGAGNTAAKKITVNKFVMGGAVSANGRANIGANGKLENIRVGATANVKANNVAGNYVGTATFRVVYR